MNAFHGSGNVNPCIPTLLVLDSIVAATLALVLRCQPNVSVAMRGLTAGVLGNRS
jgi:hypothetical protein